MGGQLSIINHHKSKCNDFWPCREEILYYMGLLDFRVGPFILQNKPRSPGLIQSQMKKPTAWIKLDVLR
jgi:hypothetical protein